MATILSGSLLRETPKESVYRVTVLIVHSRNRCELHS